MTNNFPYRQDKHMRIIMSVAAFFALACSSNLTMADNDAKEPAALTQARAAYQAQINAAVDPIKQKYIQQLDALKKQLGANGDIAGATAVQKEIDTVKSTKNDKKKEYPVIGKYIGELGTLFIPMQESGVPDELSVTEEGNLLTIKGTKKSDTVVYSSKLCGHLGKVVLFPSSIVKSTINIKVPASNDGTSYYSVVETEKGLVSQRLDLEVGKTYQYDIRIKGSKVAIYIGNKQSISVDKKDFIKFGVAATVRYPSANSAHIEISY